MGVILAVAGCLVARGADAPPPAVEMPPTVSNLLAGARLTNPRLRAQAARVEAADHDAAAVDGFYDTALSAATGFAEGPLRTPGSVLPGVAPTESWVAEASVTRPIRQGLRLRGSLARWDSLGGGAADNTSASVAGVSVEKPLLRDRGFATQRLDSEAAVLGAEEARAWRAAGWQDTCHAVTRAYADWLAAHAEITESLTASGRVARLLEETEARVALETTPAYQLASARMEVAFRQDELHQARAALQAARIRLEELVGEALPEGVLPAPSPTELRRWAETCATAGRASPVALMVTDRPEWLAAAAAAAQADTRVRRAREDLKSDLSLVAGAGLRVNNATGAHADGDLAWEAGVVWRRPLGCDVERARAEARAADARAARADLAAVANAAAAEYARARTAFASACVRLEFVDRAVEAARASLDAESDRFRLGEGRSRLVLDAQKDLSAATRRANAAAAETIDAFTDLARAAGVPFAPLRAGTEPRGEP
jgi:outer membrane protein TolC